MILLSIWNRGNDTFGVTKRAWSDMKICPVPFCEKLNGLKNDIVGSISLAVQRSMVQNYSARLMVLL